MGITKDYSRFSASGQSFGLIASPDSNVRFINIKNNPDKLIASSGCQQINIWNLKTKQLVYTLGSGSAKITCFDVLASGSSLIAVGHENGCIQVFDYESQELKCTFNGHKNAVSCLSFDWSKMRLVSGGKDTTLAVWDLVNESGLFRLKGHKNVIVKCQFMKKYDKYLISCSKDGIIKFWDVDTQHCFKTLIAHRSQVLDFLLFKDDTRLITGSDDIKVWKISLKEDVKKKNENNQDEEKEDEASTEQDNRNDDEEVDEDSENFEDETCIFSVSKYGNILRESVSRFRGFSMDSSERMFLCYGKDSTIECFKIRTDDEIKQRLQKKARKERKNQQKRLANSEEFKDNEEIIDKQVLLTLRDEIERIKVITAGHKVRFCDTFWRKNYAKIVVLLLNNSIESYSMKMDNFETVKLCELEREGHRGDVKTLSFSSDNLSILSASNDCLKIWNRQSHNCVSTISEDYEPALCSSFIESDRLAVTGTKTGKLQIFDIGSAKIIETVEASDPPGLSVRSLNVCPDNKTLVTGCEDKTVKFWQLEYVKKKKSSTKSTLTLVHTRTLQLDEEVLCVKITPNEKFLAVSLLDCSVKIFYMDTLKFFLTLYGHKLPIFSMDISWDSKMIATASSDKNLKFWGLDFGDCHKSIFAHDLPITSVTFIPSTHLLFTASNDKTIKQWDGQSFEKIMTLKLHHGEVLCIAISPNGKYLVSASRDKTLRIWEETDEPLILEEEQEIEREEEMDKENEAFDNHVIAGESNPESTLPIKSTQETVIATERLIEAIEIFQTTIAAQKHSHKQCDSTNKQSTPKRATLHPLMMAYQTECPHRFMLKIILQIKSTEIQEALISLPFNFVSDLLKILCDILDRQWEREIVIRLICFLIRIHFGQISSTPSLVNTVDRLRKILKPALLEIKDLFGVNLSAVQYLQGEIEAQEEVQLFMETYKKQEKSKKKRAKKIVENAPILSLK